MTASAPLGAAAAGPIGLLGGSFDPVHAGHLQLALCAESALGLTQLVFVPAGQPWQKSGVSAGLHRLQMLQLALAQWPRWDVDKGELERAGPSYTIDTLLAMRARIGAHRPLVWLLGYDQLRRLPTWHRWRELTSLAHLAYARRPGSAGDLAPELTQFLQGKAGSAADLAREPGGRVAEFPMPPVDCSASTIRQALARGDEGPARAFVPSAVLDYARSHQLYTRAHGH